MGEYDESQPFNIDDHDIGARAYNYGYSNYLANDLYVIHLDTNRQRIDTWSWKYKYYFSGMCRSILKNYIFRNLLTYFPSFVLISILKSAKQSIRKGPLVWKCYFYSIGLFLKNLPETLIYKSFGFNFDDSEIVNGIGKVIVLLINSKSLSDFYNNIEHSPDKMHHDFCGLVIVASIYEKYNTPNFEG